MALPNVEWEFIEDLVIEPEDAYAAAEQLAVRPLHGLVLISGTFQLGHLALILKKRIDQPVLLWAFEEPPYDGGRIRFNSVCGLNSTPPTCTRQAGMMLVMWLARRSTSIG